MTANVNAFLMQALLELQIRAHVILLTELNHQILVFQMLLQDLQHLALDTRILIVFNQPQARAVIISQQSQVEL